MINEELLKAALLGTDRYVPNYELPGTDLAEIIQDENKESLYLKQVAAAVLYAESGQKSRTQAIDNQSFKGEEVSCFNESITRFFKTGFRDNDAVLIAFLLENTGDGDEKLNPAIVPLALNFAIKNSLLAAAVVQLCGEVGSWLCGLNPAWEKLSSADPEIDFETASPASRVAYLKQLRRTDPNGARELIISQIKQESAEKREALIATMSENISDADLDFLTNILEKDKSKKVKETALSLLLQISNSEIATSFENYLNEAITIKSERTKILLKKQRLNFSKDVSLPEMARKVGIETISSQKKIPDHIHQIAEVMGYVPVSRLAKILEVTVEELILLFQNSPHTVYFKNYMTASAVLFREEEVAEALMENYFDARLVEILPLAKQLNYFGKSQHGQVGSAIIRNLIKGEMKTIPAALAKKLLSFLEKQPYVVNSPEYYALGFCLPASMTSTLDAYVQNDKTHQFFSKNIYELLRGMQTRDKILSTLKHKK